MNEQELYALLLENIALQLRHPAYDRTLEVRHFAHSMTTGANQDAEVTRYRRFEDDDLKKQRIRLYNPRTKYALARPRKYWKRISRVEGVRININSSNQARLAELDQTLYNFMPGKDLQTWLNEKLEHLGATDPNAWIVYERYDTRDVQGQIIRTRVWPHIVPSVDALNFEYYYGNLQYFVFRTTGIDRVISNGNIRENMIENYYLYAPGYIIQAREVGERTKQEDGDNVETIEVMYSGAVNSPYFQPGKKLRSFYVRVIQNGTSEVPAMRAGCYPDEKTGKDCFVPWFDPAEHILLDLIRDKSSLDVTKTVHTYPRRYEFVKPCRFTADNGAQCVGGYLNDIRDDEHLCPSCRGSGKAANFTTEQEVLQLVMPEDAGAGLVELNKLSFTEPIDINLPEFLTRQVDEDEARIMAAVFDSGLYQRPNETTTRTATEIDAVMDGIGDVLKPFDSLISQHFELVYRVGAQYWELPDFSVDHSFPDNYDIATVGELVAGFKSIKDSGAGFEAIAAQRKRVFQKVFEGDAKTQRRIAARYNWLPFDDKNPEEVAMILAARSPLDDTRVLRENWLEIFREIEQEEPDFPEMAWIRQREIVFAKVQDFKSRIMLIDAPTDIQITDTIPMP